MRTHPAAVPFVVLALAAGVRAAQEPATPADRLPIQLDVVVTDERGRPIPDLTPADFVLRDDEAVQTIDVVERAATPAAGRRIALLLDDFHVTPENTPRVREALLRLLDEDLRSDDVVILVRPLDSLPDLGAILDRGALRERIATFEGRRDDYAPRSRFEETFMSWAPATASAQRAQVVLSALQSLALHLGRLGEGRKTLIVVSEGFVRAPRRDGLRVPDVQAIIRSADRSDVAIYAIDPTPASDRPPSQDPEPDARTMLRTLAEATGGALVDTGALADGLPRAIADLDAYYRVAYRSTHAPDGRRHPLDVTVTRAGARVRARTAHWAARPDTGRRGGAGEGTPALRLPRRGQQASPLIRPWFGMSRGSDGKTRLTFTWEPSPRRRPAAETLSMTALAADGTVVFDGRVDPVRTIGAAGEPTLRAVLEAPPGAIELEMTIRGADGRTLGSDIRNLNLRDFSAPRSALATPEIFRTRSALEFRTLSADLTAPPVASRAFSRTERLLIRVLAYGDNAEPPVVTARLVSRTQQRLRELPALAGPPPGVIQFALPLSSLAIGPYGIEITAGRERELILFDVTN